MHSGLIIGLLRVLEALFFTGFVGCTLVVIISWVSIFKNGFSREDEHSLSLQDKHNLHKY